MKKKSGGCAGRGMDVMKLKTAGSTTKKKPSTYMAGGMAKKKKMGYAHGGSVEEANCGASMKPNRKART